MALDYRRHFGCLFLAVGLLSLAPHFGVVDPFVTYWALVGFLHAVAVVVSLRATSPLRYRLLFIFGATVFSVATPYGGMTFANWVGAERLSQAWWLLSYSAGSAIGAVSYWALVRGWFIPNLTRHSLMRTVVFCVSATLLALGAQELIGRFGDPDQLPLDLPTICWWTAFSTSLFLTQHSPSSSADLKWSPG